LRHFISPILHKTFSMAAGIKINLILPAGKTI